MTNSHKMVRKAELVSSITSPVTRVCMALQKYAVLWSETSVVKFNSDASPFPDSVTVYFMSERGEEGLARSNHSMVGSGSPVNKQLKRAVSPTITVAFIGSVSIASGTVRGGRGGGGGGGGGRGGRGGGGGGRERI